MITEKSLLIAIALVSLAATAVARPVKVTLAQRGKALWPVVISTGTTERVGTVATNLATMLTRITSAPFEVVNGDGREGIVVGLPGDFPAAGIKPDFHPERHTGREDYLLQSQRRGLYILGATEMAVQHGVWDFLYRLGFRQFFPGKEWEILPALPTLQVDIDTLQRPTFNARTLSSGTSRGGKDGFSDRDSYRDWMERNRMSDGWSGSGGHIYGFIIRARKEEFEKHPEYLALVDGERRGQKLCISNPGLRQLVIDYVLERLEREPHADAISMEPSDGGGFCECEECAKLGSISSQVVYLANVVAEALEKVHPDKYVSILAYNFHTAPPEIRLHPRIVVTVCAGQLTGNWQPNELFEAWTAQGANSDGIGFGVFEYYSNIVGNRFMPGGPRAANIEYMRRSITGFYERGARRLRSGAAYSNGTVSLGIYLASRMLWDLDEAERIDALYADFLEKSFGKAAGAMDHFMRLIYHFEGDPKLPPLTSDTVGRMYRALERSWLLADDAAIRERIKHFILYTRYVEMQLASQQAPANERDEAFSDVMRHAWRIRDTMMVNVYGLFTYPPRGYDPETYGWRVISGENPWKAGEPYSEAEILAMMRDGMANNAVGEFETRAFSEELVPAASALGWEDQEPGPHGLGLPPQGKQEFYTWVDKAPATISLRVAGGFIWPKRSSNVEITLYSDKAVSDAADFVVVHDKSVPPDQEEHLVELRTPYDGLHRILVDGGPGATRVLPGNTNMAFTVQAGPVTCFNRRHTWEGWFYVPRGTRQISFHVAQNQGAVRDPDGNVVLHLARQWHDADGTTHEPPQQAGYHTVAVPAGRDGRLWRLSDVRTPWLFLNIPPYIARRPFELLLPCEVVEQDSQK